MLLSLRRLCAVFAYVFADLCFGFVKSLPTKNSKIHLKKFWWNKLFLSGFILTTVEILGRFRFFTKSFENYSFSLKETTCATFASSRPSLVFWIHLWFMKNFTFRVWPNFHIFEFFSSRFVCFLLNDILKLLVFPQGNERCKAARVLHVSSWSVRFYLSGRGVKFSIKNARGVYSIF